MSFDPVSVALWTGFAACLFDVLGLGAILSLKGLWRDEAVYPLLAPLIGSTAGLFLAATGKMTPVALCATVASITLPFAHLALMSMDMRLRASRIG